mmetsp:Transcript_4157/g.17506  ORF Transcript_4157/g.17506 Transcript_4157/m.17506 type:complete len:149 (-) Transcript_4157:4352-4798(-)
MIRTTWMMMVKGFWEISNLPRLGELKANNCSFFFALNLFQDILRRLEEHKRSFGFKDFVRPRKGTSELQDEDIEDEIEDLKRKGFVPMRWDETFSEEELLYLRTPDLPFDPINRRAYPKVEDPPPLSVDDVHFAPIDQVDLSKIRPLK